MNGNKSAATIVIIHLSKISYQENDFSKSK